MRRMTSRLGFRLLGLRLAAIATAGLVASTTYGEEVEPSEKEIPPVLNHEVKTIGDEDCRLADKYAGQVLLIVNVASRCGATPQYKDLQALHKKYADKGLAVLGFPCNQFGAQEPGSEAEILEFCTSRYEVSFDMFSKIDVNGDEAAALYKTLTSKETTPDDPGPVKWNFEKFLVGRDGAVKARFRTPVNPSSDEVVEAIERELEAKAPEQAAE